MSDPAWQALLDRPLTAVVTTLRRNDGTPHSVPVWYRSDGDRLIVWTGAEREWVRNLESDPRVSVAVAEHEAPYAAVLMRGTAEIVTDTEWVDDEARRISDRYLPAGEVDGYVRRWEDLRTIVVVHIDWQRGWGKGY